MRIAAIVYLLAFFIVYVMLLVRGLIKGYSDPKLYAANCITAIIGVVGFFSVLYLI